MSVIIETDNGTARLWRVGDLPLLEFRRPLVSPDHEEVVLQSMRNGALTPRMTTVYGPRGAATVVLAPDDDVGRWWRVVRSTPKFSGSREALRQAVRPAELANVGASSTAIAATVPRMDGGCIGPASAGMGCGLVPCAPMGGMLDSQYLGVPVWGWAAGGVLLGGAVALAVRKKKPKGRARS